MKNEPFIIDKDEIERVRFKNIIDVGLTASAMIRLYAHGMKESELCPHAVETVQRILQAKSESEFKKIHAQFCQWGTERILLARKDKYASYGQIAKTLDVILKVVVYYCHLPEFRRSEEIMLWLNAAVDTKMMRMLRRCYPMVLDPWPHTIDQVDRQSYLKIQEIVREFIHEIHQGSIIPVQFDDYYWRKLKYTTA